MTSSTSPENRLVCQDCGAAFALDDPRWQCDCGGLLDLEFEAMLDLEKIRARPPSLWRYREALPLDRDENIVSFGEGFTPLIEIEGDGRVLHAKLEQLFPTGSYKDRGASVLISKAKELGVTKVVEDSSGNAGCAVAAYCARAGIECHIYVPESASPGKLAQIQMYGADLHKIPGTREATAQATLKAAEQVFYASHVWNPFFFHGTKTFAYEVWEQLGCRVPDSLLLPAGNGTLLIGAYLGFKDLAAQNLAPSLPRLIAVQSENCAPLYRMKQGSQEEPDPQETMAEGIAIAAPRRARQMVNLVTETGGCVMTVSEEEIRRSVKELGRKGLYVEPTSAVAWAAFQNYSPRKGEVVVAPLTGHGLKSTEKMLKLV